MLLSRPTSSQKAWLTDAVNEKEEVLLRSSAAKSRGSSFADHTCISRDTKNAWEKDTTQFLAVSPCAQPNKDSDRKVKKKHVKERGKLNEEMSAYNWIKNSEVWAFISLRQDGKYIDK